MKMRYKKFISLLLAVVILLSSVMFSAVSVAAATPKVVTTDAVRLRSSAEISSNNVIDTLDVEEELTLLENSTDGWAYVKRDDGTKGYCSIDYLNVKDDGAVEFNGITTDDVNFRKGASTEYDIINVLSKGTEFKVVDNSNENWVKALVGSTEGYIYRTYTELSLVISKTQENIATTTPDWFESSVLNDIVGDSVSDDSAPLAAGISLSYSNITVEVSKTFTLAALVTGGASVQNSVEFSSSDKSIATVSKDGTVKGLKEGKATITAILPDTDLSSACTVNVIPKSEDIPTEPESSIELSSTELSVAVGNHGHIRANKEVSWKSSDTSILTVSSGIITAKAKGTATVTASADGQTAECKVTVTSASSEVTIRKSTASVTVGKTYYNGATSSNAISWSSSDTSIAEVENGFITGKSSGKVVITAYNSSGTKTCLVTVNEAEPVRFAYSQPNTAAPSETVTLYAVTDKNRTAVKFEVTVGSKTTTVNATEKISDSGTLVWSGTTQISTSGTHKVVAYAMASDGKWKTCSSGCDDAVTSVFIRQTADKKTETLEPRRATDEAITLISQFEGYSPTVYFDTIANNIPTLGYGKVLYVGDSFYNDMTKREAYAYLVQTVNNGGYTSQLNAYLDKYELYRNQQHFDSLLSFVYNLGAYMLSSDDDFKEIFLATGITESSSASETDAYVNASNVNFRAQATTSSAILDCLDYGTVLILIETEAQNNWYHVKTEDGTEGYIYADYVTKGRLTSSGKCYLSRVDNEAFNKLMLQYHHAGATCVWGLLYRRVDELDVFYYGEYSRNGSKNIYDYDFTCGVNSSTTL